MSDESLLSLRPVLEYLTQPVLLVKDGVILYRNSAAVVLEVEPGSSIFQLLGATADFYREYDGTGMLSLTFDHGAMTMEASIHRHDGIDLFAITALPPEAPSLGTLSVVAQTLRGPVSSLFSTAAVLFPYLEELEKLLTADQTPQQLLEASAQAAALANQAIQAEAERREECRNMGTTLVSAISYDGGVVVTNVGDSRAYHITEDGITRITKDHSLVESMVDRGDITAEEARRHPSRNLITRALGPDISADCDGYICPMNAGEYLLLCSDGLVNTVTDQEMLFEVIHGDGPDTCLDRLLAIAKRQGAPDNVTAVLMQKQ